MSSKIALFATCIALGCAPPSVETPAGARGQRSTQALPTQSPEPLPEYVVRLPARQVRGSRFELAPGKLGLIVRGERWLVDDRGALTKRVDDGLDVNRAIQVGKGAGGGFLFIGSAGLYSAREFDGELVRLAGPGVSGAATGPGFVLVSFDDGRVRSVDRSSGKPGPALPVATFDLATGDDGTAVALTHGARVFVSRDKGATWSDITQAVGTPVELVERQGKVFVNEAAGETTKVDAQGAARAALPAEPAPPFDARWTRVESPIELAVQRGARASADRAWVSDAGSIFEVSVVTGEVLATEQGVLPPNGSCDQASVADSVLFFCTQSDSAAVFRRSKQGGATKLEKTFPTNGTFLVGAGDAILFAGPCDAASSLPGMACARSRDGAWSTLDRSGEIADAPKTDPLRLVGWVPKEDGAYLLVAGKGGGLWDAKTGAKTKLDEPEIARLEPLLRLSQSGRTNIVDRLAVVDGSIVGFGPDGVGFKLADGGKRVERSPFRMRSVSGTRAQWLGRDPASGTLWQSVDWGFTFTEVDGPPDPSNARDDVRSCSEVGCAFTQWLRLGWAASVPKARAPKLPAQPQPDPHVAKLMQLECTASGAMTRRSALPGALDRSGFGAELLKPEPGGYLALFPRGVFHGSLGFIEAASLRAIATGKLPSFDGPSPPAAALSQTRRYRFIEPFDAKGAIREGTLRLADLIDAARGSGAASPDLTTLDERGQSTITLADPPGVVLSGNGSPVLWLRAKQKPLALGIPSDISLTVFSAVETGNEELTVLMQGANGETLVRSLGRGRATEPFSVAPLPAAHTQALADALAVAPDGKLAIVRLTTETPPTKEDPAYLLRPGEPPLPLAPWSTLDVDGSAACATMTGHRVIVQTQKPWLSLGMSADTSGDRPSSLRVRWSTSQVCLEAAEIPLGVHELPSGNQAESYIAARFGKDGGAGHVLVAEGAELREARTCKLIR